MARWHRVVRSTKRLCRAYGVLRLDVFGSAVRDDFDQTRSDDDFLVEFTTDARDGTAFATTSTCATSLLGCWTGQWTWSWPGR